MYFLIIIAVFKEHCCTLPLYHTTLCSTPLNVLCYNFQAEFAANLSTPAECSCTVGTHDLHLTPNVDGG